MGVHGFLTFLRRYFPSAFVQSWPRGKVGFVNYDLNGEIHRAWEKAGMGSETIDPKLLEAKIQFLLIERFKELQKIFRPKYGTIVCIDGIAPLSKMQQQKQRRFAAHRKIIPKFDRNSISPGTAFMFNLDDFLTAQFSELRAKSELPPYFIYSGHRTPGEGEHKIFDYLRSGKISAAIPAHETEICHLVYGDDADLVINCLISPVEKLYVVRENNLVVDIQRLRGLISEKMSRRPHALYDFVLMVSLVGNDFLPTPAALRSVYRDTFDLRRFVRPTVNPDGSETYNFPLGIESIEGSVDLLLQIYGKLDIDLTYPDKTINWINFSRFIQTLSQFENYLIQIEISRVDVSENRLKKYATRVTPDGRQQFILRGHPADGSYSDVLYDMYDGEKTRVVNGYELFRGTTSFQNALYNMELSPKTFNFPFSDAVKLFGVINLPHPSFSQINNMALTFLSGLQWTYVYYIYGYNYINTEWYYNYYRAPLLSELSSCTQLSIEEFKTPVSDYQRPLLTQISQGLPAFTFYLSFPYAYPGMTQWTILHQLIGILPTTSSNLLPRDFNKLLSWTSPIIDLYPVQYVFDFDGMTLEDYGRAIIPFIQTSRIFQAVDNVIKQKKRFNLSNFQNKLPIVATPDNFYFQAYQTFYQKTFREIQSSGPDRGRGGFADRGRGDRGRGGFTDRGRGDGNQGRRGGDRGRGGFVDRGRGNQGRGGFADRGRGGQNRGGPRGSDRGRGRGGFGDRERGQNFSRQMTDRGRSKLY